MNKRRRSRTVRIGDVSIGGDNPVAIQSMANTPTKDVARTAGQINQLAEAGAEIMRVSVKDLADAQAIKSIVKKIDVPLVADIHFDHRLALLAIECGADKIRINPGNIGGEDKLVGVIRAAKAKHIPIRIGLNSGSMPESILKGKKKDRDSKVAAFVRGYLKIFEKEKFRDIVISIKSSDVAEMISFYRAVAGMCDYPLHLGVTAAGSRDSGIVKSSIGMGALLLDGIGDTLRVSLTADPIEEVRAAKMILQSSGTRVFGPDVIACPTCGRTQVDLVRIVNDFEKKLSGLKLKKFPKSVAIMGCEVNGPGEAKEASIGIAFGKNSGAIFKDGKIISKAKDSDSINQLLKLVKGMR